jgi:hypothetical protein
MHPFEEKVGKYFSFFDDLKFSNRLPMGRAGEFDDARDDDFGSGYAGVGGMLGAADGGFAGGDAG